MGGGIFDDGWDAYSDGWDKYAYPWAQPRPPFHRPGGPMNGTVPQGRPFQKMDEPKKKKKKTTVKIIPVRDGGAPVPEVPVKRAAEPVIVSRFKSWDAAATKIQTVFRGYVVRKSKPLSNLRVIRNVEEELELFKNKLQRPAQLQKLYNESKERLRWTEGVMALLLRLDSLQGVHPEVRLIRRALTKELIRFQEAIDEMSTEMSEEDDVLSTEDNNLTKEHAEVIDFAALEGKEFEESDPEEFSALGQDFTSGGADEVLESDNEVPMDVEIKERVLTMERPHPVEERELELANGPPDVETLNEEAPLVDVSGESTPSREVISEPISEEFVSATPPMSDAEVCEQATVTGREEAENMVEEEAGRPTLVPFQFGDFRQGTASECRDQGEGFINPASDSLLLEPPWLQAGKPQPSTDGLSDHSLLLQVLEENRKLKEVVGKVLLWGNRKDDVIQNLLSRIEHLEERRPSPDLLHCEESDGRKKNGRWLEKGRKTGKTRYPFGYADPEDSLSAGSGDWFSDDFLW